MRSGTGNELSIVAGSAHPVLGVAADELARCWSARCGHAGKVVRPDQRLEGPRVALRLASLVCPTVLVRFEAPYRGEAAERGARLALTPLSWEGVEEGEVWRALSRPIASVSCRGKPDLSRPWAVTLARQRVPAPSVPSGVQLHVIGSSRMLDLQCVSWPVTERAAGAVLGRADHVIGRRDPLAYDALRLGIPVVAGALAAEREPCHPCLELAGMVPAPLLRDEELWMHVAEIARWVHDHGESPPALMTSAWIARARETMRQRVSIPPPAWRRTRRKYHKLTRDPERFFADSPHAAVRALGRFRFS